MARDFKLRGDNSSAWWSRAADLLLCGPAGTGKTIALMFKMRNYAEKNAGARCLLVRKTRASLTESGLVTWEKDVLGRTHKILRSRPILPRVRQDYIFDNGSTVVVAGMDKPDKVLSSQWDFIYLLEATDFTLNDFETISGRIRTGADAAGPYQQLVADCNPTNPSHWLYSRITSGKMARFNSRHQDNPAYWDCERREWTKAGRRYLARLESMTGARRKRFLEGIWAAAEGLVFDGYDPKVHDLPAGWRPPAGWRTFWSIDWGYTAPLSLQMWALDGDNRMYLYREVYQTGMRVETLAKMARKWVETHEELRPIGVVTDHDPEAQENWRVHSGLPAESAWKEDKYAGIETAQGFFDVAGDGKPRIFFNPTARYHNADYSLSSTGKPTCTLEELAGYVWDVKDVDKKAAKEMPVKLNDHGCFIAGTMVETSNGPVAIERIYEGDRVLTRGGYRTVVAAEMTADRAIVKRLALSNGTAIVGTGEHPIFTERGLIRLDDMRYGDKILPITENSLWRSLSSKARENQSECDSTASSTGVIQNRNTSLTENTSAADMPTCYADSATFTAPSGRSTMGRSPTVTKSTTTMETPAITAWGTSSYSPLKSTRQSTVMSLPIGLGGYSPNGPTLTRGCLNWPPNGIDHQRGEHGILSTLLKLWRTCRWLSWFARFVNRFTKPKRLWPESRFSARISADQRLGEILASMTKIESVDAVNPSELIDTASKEPAPVVVRIDNVPGFHHVYNITVEGDHEYYANGVLVHNCDNLRYACNYIARMNAGQYASTGSVSDNVLGDIRNESW